MVLGHKTSILRVHNVNKECQPYWFVIGLLGFPLEQTKSWRSSCSMCIWASNPPPLFLTPLCWQGAWCPVGKARKQISNRIFRTPSILKAAPAPRTDTLHFFPKVFPKSEQRSIFVAAQSSVLQKALKVWEWGGAMDSSFKAEKLLSELHRVCLQTSGNKNIDGYWASGCKRFKECLKDSISNCPVLWRLSKTFTDILQTTPRGNLPTLPLLWNSSETIMCSAYPGT